MNFNEGRKTNRREIRTVLGGASDFRLSANGKKLLVRKDDAFTIVDAAPDQRLDKPLNLAAMTTEIDPRAEWRQIFNDAWRFYRDFFYDSQMRGVDWTRVREKYLKFLDVCASRDDLDYVIGEMAGELGNSHVFVFSTSTGQQSEGVGMLGVDFGLDHGAYRIRSGTVYTETHEFARCGLKDFDEHAYTPRRKRDRAHRSGCPRCICFGGWRDDYGSHPGGLQRARF